MSSCGTTVAAATRPTAVGSRSRADPRLLSAARGAHRRRSGPGPGPGQRHRHPRVLRPLAAGLPPFQSSVEDERVVLAYVGPEGFTGALLEEAAPDHVLRMEALPRSGRQNKVNKQRLRELARERFQIP